MNKFWCLLCLNLLLINSLSVHAQQIFSEGAVQADLAFLKNNIEGYHPNHLAHISESRFYGLYDSLHSAINRPMSYLEAFHHIAPLIISLQDGHTSIHHRNKFANKKTKFIPFYIRKLDNKYYISYNYSNDSTLQRGTEILTIDGQSLDKIFEQLKTLISADNYNESARLYYLQANFGGYYWQYFGAKDSVIIQYRFAQKVDSIRTKTVVCLDKKAIGNWLNKRYKWAIRKNLEFKMVDSLSHTAKIDINSFLMNKKLRFLNLKFKRALKHDFREIKNKGIQNLIIDVRGNGGGAVKNISRVLRYLLPKPFTLVDTLSFKQKSYFKLAPIYTILPPVLLGVFFKKDINALRIYANGKTDRQKPEKQLHFDGKVFFLINAGAYSATVSTIAMAKDRGIGIFVGEAAGGASWGSHAITWHDFRLPNTHIKIHLPLMRMKHKLNHTPVNYFLQPDYTVLRSYTELIKNNDNVLDFTLDLIRAKK